MQKIEKAMKKQISKEQYFEEGEFVDESDIEDEV